MRGILKLKKSNCKNCYKCIRHCPVKSIRFSGNQAHIIQDECILCGQCFVVCPQNAKVISDDTEKAKVLLNSGKPVVASIAPSFIANYDNTNISSIEKALKKLGFTAIEETAVGATIVKKQYESLIEKKEQNIIISSCCHTVNLLIQKDFPQALPYLAKVVSPMHAHCKELKKKHPDALTVFIGPCLSKKAEGDLYEDDIDCVLTFEELSKWLKSENIQLESVNEDVENESRARFFPTAGGILKTMDCTSSDYIYLEIDGIDNCINALVDIVEGNLSNCFIEMSACSGSCIGGPVMDKDHKNYIRDYITISEYAGKNDFITDRYTDDFLSKEYKQIDVQKSSPSEEQVKQILAQMGKTKLEDELNCGSCGYNSCREKAIAVCEGKADISMCLPFLKDKEESFSSNILKNSPNGIFLLNDILEVQQINDAALKIMNIRRASDVIGEQVVRILDPANFLTVSKTGKLIKAKCVYLAEYKKYVEQTIVYDKSFHTIMCIMRDITDERIQSEKKEEISRQTIEVTDKVIEKQMRAVQEIASLLGETTAETKIALTKLKESMTDE